MGEATNKIRTANDDDRSISTQESYIAVGSTDDIDDPEQLRAEIEDTRAEMSQTINEIQERLSPENVMDQVKEKVREATLGKVERVMNRVGETIGDVTEPAREVAGQAGKAVMETGRSAAGAVWRNPIPVALIGLGVGMLVMRSVRRGNGYDYDDMSRSRSRTMRRQSLAPGEVNDYGWRHAQRHTGGLNRVKETASSLGTRLGHMMRENPLAVGAVAIAAGTAVGLMLPTTRFEDEYIGETSSQLMDKAQEVAREAIDKVQSTAEQMTQDQPQQQQQR